MKKIILMVIIFVIPLISALSISEVELNPSGTDGGSEWVELYSEESIDLHEYRLVNNDGDEILLEMTMKGYYVYTFDKQWLDNSDEKIILYLGDEKIDETDLLDDSRNDDSTWSYCDEWIFDGESRGEENGCDPGINENEEKSDNEEEDEEKNENSGLDDEKELEPEENYSEIIQPEPKTIKLDTKDIKSEENNSNQNKYTIYGFILFCVLIVILFTLHKKRFTKNEFN